MAIDDLSPTGRGWAAGVCEAIVRTYATELASSDGATESIYIGLGAAAGANGGARNVVVGANAGRRLRTGSDNILIGAYTEVPAPDTCNFVNIGNRLCFWRDTGELAPVPPPYDEE